MYKPSAVPLVAVVLLFLGGPAQAAQSSKRAAQKATSGTAVPRSGDSSLDRERLELDKKKFASDTEIENKKLEIEREKLEIEKSTWSHLSTMVPWIGAFLTLAYGIWSFRSQAKLQFEIEAAKIAFSRETAKAVKSRARALKLIFPKRLPDGFTKDFEPKDFGGEREPSDEKKFFAELLFKNLDKQTEVFDLWAKLFPGDEVWLKRLKAPPAPSSSSDQHAPGNRDVKS